VPDIGSVNAKVQEWARKIHRKALHLPKPLRILLGIALICGGFLWFLPVLGLWMLPLGIIILSIDVPWVRRLWRRFLVWWERRRRRIAAQRPG
jgi:hypothetical protein